MMLSRNFCMLVTQYQLTKACTDKQIHLRTSLVVCGAAIFLKISASTELDPGGRDSLANTVGWCGWRSRNSSMCAPLNSTDVLLSICLTKRLHQRSVFQLVDYKTL